MVSSLFYYIEEYQKVHHILHTLSKFTRFDLKDLINGIIHSNFQA